jgi:hypothetical protein
MRANKDGRGQYYLRYGIYASRERSRKSLGVL